MSTASALLAPAAPVSTGTSAAALGAKSADAGLFSSKVADALNAGVHGAPVERMTPGRLTGARSLGIIMAQPMAAEPGTDTATPTTESGPTISGEIADSAVQPSLADEQQIGTDTAANDDDTPGLVAATPFTAAQPTPAVPVAQSIVVAGSPAVSEDAAEIFVEPKAPKDVASVAFVAPEAMKTTVATNARAATGTAAKTASAPANQDLEAKTALTAANAQAVLSELSEILTTEASTSSPAAAKPAEFKAAEVSVTPAQPTMTTDGPKPIVAPAPDATVTGEAAPRPTNAAPPAPANFDAATATTIQTAVANTDKPAAPSPIAQSLAAAQIPAAQVQIAANATTPRPSAIAPADVVAALNEAASEQPAEAAPADTPKPPTSLQAAAPLRGNRHGALDQTGETAVPAAQTATTEDAPPSSTAIQVAAKPTPSPAKAAEAAIAAVATSEPASPEASTASPAPVDAQPAQQAAASSHAQGLSTLSRATVETTAQLAAQMARKLEGRSTRFDMVLTPEDLGRVDVSLEIGKDGQLSARLAFDNPAAAADLKGRADELRRQLQEAGFQVAGDALDFSQRDPSAGGGAFERQQQRNALFAGGSRLAAQADMPIVPAPGAWINNSLTPDRVDLKV